MLVVFALFLDIYNSYFNISSGDLFLFYTKKVNFFLLFYLFVVHHWEQQIHIILVQVHLLGTSEVLNGNNEATLIFSPASSTYLMFQILQLHLMILVLKFVVYSMF
jgi:hypothetical protein